MTKDIAPLLRDLSEHYDPHNHNTYITVYFNKKDDLNYLKKRQTACEHALNANEKQNFHDTITQITDHLNKTQDTYGAIFASHTHNYFQTINLSVPIYNALIVDTSPYIRPLARIQDEWESFTLVLLNSHTIKIYDVDLGDISQEQKISKDIINKHKKGGQSQARFQRIRKNAIHHFLKEAITALEKHHEQHIILAGPGTAKTHFYDQLPKPLQQKIFATLDIDMDDEQQLFQESFKLITEKEHQHTQDTLNHLKKEILTDGLATYGLGQTLKAAQQGKIDILIIQKDYKVKGCICEHCQIVKAGPIHNCSLCGEPTSEADIIEEIIEFAERTDASYEFTDDPYIADLGHIAAILRYK